MKERIGGVMEPDSDSDRVKSGTVTLTLPALDLGVDFQLFESVFPKKWNRNASRTRTQLGNFANRRMCFSSQFCYDELCAQTERCNFLGRWSQCWESLAEIRLQG